MKIYNEAETVVRSHSFRKCVKTKDFEVEQSKTVSVMFNMKNEQDCTMKHNILFEILSLRFTNIEDLFLQ